jgi:uracil DNA glycosylase superfamily protein
MPVMPDILAPGLDVVFCGTAPGERSAARGHYFAGHGNRFWNFLHESGLTGELLAPEDDHRLPEFGIGLTDLVKDAAQSHDRGLEFSGTPGLERRLLPAAPRWVAFAGITAGARAVKPSVPCAASRCPGLDRGRCPCLRRHQSERRQRPRPVGRSGTQGRLVDRTRLPDSRRALTRRVNPRTLRCVRPTGRRGCVGSPHGCSRPRRRGRGRSSGGCGRAG